MASECTRMVAFTEKRSEADRSSQEGCETSGGGHAALYGGYVRLVETLRESPSYEKRILKSSIARL